MHSTVIKLQGLFHAASDTNIRTWKMCFQMFQPTESLKIFHMRFTAPSSVSHEPFKAKTSFFLMEPYCVFSFVFFWLNWERLQKQVRPLVVKCCSLLPRRMCAVLFSCWVSLLFLLPLRFPYQFLPLPLLGLSARGREEEWGKKAGNVF